MQRLFSTFPSGWPGLGLLLLRLGLCAALLYFDRASLASPFSEPAAALAALGGSILLAGFWTPVIATLTGLCEIWLAVSVASSPFDRKFVHAILAVVAAAVAMLGPGAWSIDARLFGRRRFEIDRTRRRPNPSK